MKYKLISIGKLTGNSCKKKFSIFNFQFSIFAIILITIFIFSCANPMPPSGGPPDKSPPIITRYAPAQGTLNFQEKSIVIEFNKYMSKNTVVENIFISPSVKMKYGWSGKELEIEFEEDLLKNTTYVLSLGTEYTDLKSNKPAETFSLIFSTGNYLDSGAITGNLIDPNPTGVNVYAYRIDNIKPDTLNPSHTKPNYRTQTGQNGKFDLVALKEGKYRLLAIRDKFKDEVYDIGLDDFGAAPFDVEVSGDSVPVMNLKIGPVKDVAGPQLFVAEGLHSNLTELTFSEKLDTNFVKSIAFEISDSASKETALVSGAMLSPKSSEKVWVFTAEPLDTNKSWKITALANQAFSLRDTSGNLINDTLNSAYFYPENTLEKTQPEIIKFPYPDSSLYVPSQSELEFIFSLPIEKNTIKNAVRFIDGDSLKIGFDLVWKSDNILRIIPHNNLELLKWYILFFKMNSLKSVNDTFGKDTMVRLKFRIADTRNYGGINGKIKGLNYADSSLKIIVFNNTNKFITSPGESGKWSLPSIPEGKYKFELFYDTDKNGKYSYGESFPFKHSEPFLLINEEKDVPSRWTIELELPAPGK